MREQFLDNNKDNNSEKSEIDYQLSSNGELNLTWETMKNETSFSIQVKNKGKT